MSFEVMMAGRAPRGMRRRAWIARFELARPMDAEACRLALGALGGDDTSDEMAIAASAMGTGRTRLVVSTRWGCFHLESAHGRRPALRVVCEDQGLRALIQAVNVLMAVLRPLAVDIRRGRGDHRRIANYYMSFEAVRTLLGGSTPPERDRLIKLQKRRSTALLRVSSGFVFVRTALRSS